MTKTEGVNIPDFDQQRLLVMIQKMLRQDLTPEQAALLQQLKERLESANICSRKAVTRDMVTMNSKVCIKDQDTGIKTFPIICFPEDANEKYGKFSILNPLAINLLGSRVGQKISVKLNYRLKHYSIEALIFQPEAAGIHV